MIAILGQGKCRKISNRISRSIRPMTFSHLCTVFSFWMSVPHLILCVILLVQSLPPALPAILWILSRLESYYCSSRKNDIAINVLSYSTYRIRFTIFIVTSKSIDFWKISRFISWSIHLAIDIDIFSKSNFLLPKSSSKKANFWWPLLSTLGMFSSLFAWNFECLLTTIIAIY